MLRILLCRAAFVCCVLLPTAVVAAWAVQRSQPAYRNAKQEEWLRFFAQRFGVKATVDRITYPSFWVARIDNLQLIEPETGVVLLQCRTLEAARTKQGWVVEASQPEVRADQLATFAELLQSRVLKHAPEDTVPCEIEIGELTLRAGERSSTVTHVRITSSSAESASELELLFRVAGVAAPQPCRLAVKRSRGESGTTTSWEFSTPDEVAMHCAAIADWLPGLKTLGPDVQFVGRAAGETSASGNRCEINGRFTAIDLNTLVSNHSAHKLTGKAEVLVAPLKFERGRIAELRGTIVSEGGYLSRSLATAAREHLKLGVDSTDPPVQDGVIPFRRLACGFRLDEKGLVLQGSADPTRDGVVFAASAGPLLLDPTAQPIPLTSVLRALVPQTELQVPAARETQPLLDILPASSILAPPKQPRGRVNLRGLPS